MQILYAWKDTPPAISAVKLSNWFKVADINFGCATFCALPSFGAVTTFSSHTALPSHKVSVKCSDIDMCIDWPQSFLFLCYIYLAFLHFFSCASLIQVCFCG